MPATPEQTGVHAASLEETLAFLDGVEPGKLPYPLFLRMAQLLTQATTELVPLRTNEDTGETEVLLTERPVGVGDPWEGEWHVPGTILLPTDELAHPKDYTAAFGRLLGEGGELKSGVRALREPVEVDTERRVTRRGPELSVIHYVEVLGEPAVGRFFGMNEFPHNVPEPGVIEHHADFIPRAVASFEGSKLK